MIDSLLSWEFDVKTANCFDFASAAWRIITGVPLPARGAVTTTASAGTAVHQALPTYQRLTEQQDPCIVVLDRPSQPGRCPHIGILYRGKLLHATESGARHEPLGLAITLLGATKVSFYLPC